MNFTDISTYWPIIVFFVAKRGNLITLKNIQIGLFLK